MSFPLLIENVDLENLKYFFESNHQVDSSLPLTRLSHSTTPEERLGQFETIMKYFQCQ